MSTAWPRRRRSAGSAARMTCTAPERFVSTIARHRALVGRVEVARLDAVRALDAFGVPREGVHASALGGERARDGQPDTAGGADDDRHAALELHAGTADRKVLRSAVGPAASEAK